MYYDKVKNIEDYIIKLRRHFHENPELSGQEFNTIKDIKKELDNLNVEYIEIENGGILGKIVGNKEGSKTVMLRADVDALPVIEKDSNLKETRVCISKNEGVMHACGHDGHISMLLGAAKVLVEEKDNFGGTVLLCFERGEEGTGNYKYIHAYMEKNNIVPDTVWAVHLLSTQESGTIGIRTDSMMAGAVFFDVTIEGQGGHGSRPDQAINPIDAFASIYSGFEALRLTKIDPFETLTYSIGSLNAGVVANVIPQTLNFKGTARFMNRDKVGYPFYENFKKLVNDTCNTYGCKATFNAYPKPGFAVTNDEKAATFATQILTKEFGDKVIIPEPWMASESMSFYLEQWPGVFAFVGMKNDEKGIGAAHHNEYFDIDESALAIGATGAVTYSIEFLNSDITFEDKKYKGKFKELLREIDETEDNIKKYYNE